jgi:predicted lipid-binding transport protein (Tim44 family)
MKQRKGFEDDGRVIANMNIEGTPWYVDHKNNPGPSSPAQPTPTRKETFYLMKGALTAGLLIGFIFILAFFGFILFCTMVWLR